MSASLVGSEMCIRDRCKTPYMGEPEPQPMRYLKARLPLETRSKRKTHPVSYTHLTLPTICSV
eukprot:8939450-Alexandrium_andersonii.AAC.1